MIKTGLILIYTQQLNYLELWGAMDVVKPFGHVGAVVQQLSASYSHKTCIYDNVTRCNIVL